MGYVEIKLDKARNFKYGMRAIDRLEKKLKKKTAQIDFNSLSMEETATVMWAGLVHEDRELTPDKVMDLVDQYSTIAAASEKMNEAMELAYGPVEVGEEEKNV